MKNHKYAEMEKRVEELEALFDSELIKLGKSDLLAEYGRLCDKLDCRDMRNRIMFNVLYYCLLLCLGFFSGLIFALKL